MLGYLKLLWLSNWDEYLAGARKFSHYPLLCKSDSSVIWVHRLRDSFSLRKGGFWLPIIHVYGMSLINLAGLKFMFLLSCCASSYFFGLVVDKNEQWSTYYLLLLSYALRAFIDAHARFYLARISLRVESGITGVAYYRILSYKKGLKFISEDAYSHNSYDKDLNRKKDPRDLISCTRSLESLIGRPDIFNLIIGDIASIQMFVNSLLDLCLLPVNLLLTWILLSYQVGFVATIPGIITFIFILILSFGYQILGTLYKGPFMEYRDYRLSICHEVLGLLRLIRIMGLEDFIYKRLMRVRKNETKFNRKRLLRIQFGSFLEYNIQKITQLIVFLFFYLYNGDKLSLSSALSSIHILHSLSTPLRGIPVSFVEGLISLLRFKYFLMLYPTEIQDTQNICDRNNLNIIYTLDQKESDNSDVTRSCHMETLEFLKGLFLENNFVIITGPPGCGKTYFLMEILNLKSPDSCYAYANQNSWISGGTVRSAIIFGRLWNKPVYNSIIECCELQYDFENWKEGDLRVVDEGGTSLSGGQRTRISLARCLYSGNEAQFYLFDDIFLNLDPSVGFKIFQKLFGPSGFFKKYDTKVLLTIDLSTLNFFSRAYNETWANLMVLYLTPCGSVLFSEKLKSNLDYGQNYMIELSNKVQHFPDLLEAIQPEDDTENQVRDNFLVTKKRNNIQSKSSHGSVYSLKHKDDLTLTSEKFSLCSTIFNSNYKWYFSLIGSSWCFLLLLSCIGRSILDRLSDIFLSSSTMRNNKLFILEYLALVMIQSVLSIILFLGEGLGGVRAADIAHEAMLRKTLFSPFSFYDLISVGFIINRFSTDLLVFDECPIKRIASVFVPSIDFVIQFLLLCYANTYAIPIVILIILVTYKFVCSKYINTYIMSQKASLEALSPLCSLFSQGINGIRIINSFNTQKFMFSQFLEQLELLQRRRFLQHIASQWAAIRLQLYTLPLTFTVMLTSNDHHWKYLALLYSVHLSDTLSIVTYRFAFMERDMCSSEKIYKLITATSYSVGNKMNIRADIPDSEKLINFHYPIASDKSELPRTGVIINNLEVGYLNKENLYNLILTNININVKPGEYIGIVGRTGSGKSTLILALLGLIEYINGQILLDNIPTSCLSLTERRKFIGVLPQSPILLKDWTLRDFIDPFSEYTDSQIWSALSKCSLDILVKNLPNSKHLDTIITEDLFSASELRCLSIVRLIINSKNYRMILVDEPPSFSVDEKISCNINELLSVYFKHCNIFLVAHNVESLRHCTKVLILANNQIVKTLHPDILSTQKDLAEMLSIYE
ncbi:ABC transporter family protein [Cryptosporidium muris RN66]|uniref:ABC transporter family protein n=1 Tax=Cryptosporidium muris (strain RN66) TaxID=441375 RepID=B6AE66_CRYMR|nr:ABC transporter family protein [Cryptosporidium muris RN66]EEA06507.1 ABC transporter family protein [Cryptosporidium muris RN66]|eukprot:XP_002140856.1 ABC transporter family protein [Cryptosporidium muris RN66]